eukprot:COSAG05_NODE_685_length_7933_cov_622.457110_3_plen_274_part_00
MALPASVDPPALVAADPCLARRRRYTAWGYAAKHIIQDPTHRRRLGELQSTNRRRIRPERLKELSMTTLAKKVEAHNEHVALHSQSTGDLVGGGSGGASQGRPSNAGVARVEKRAPRRRPCSAMRVRVRVRDISPEQLNKLQIVLETLGLPVKYASALSANGYGDIVRPQPSLAQPNLACPAYRSALEEQPACAFPLRHASGSHGGVRLPQAALSKATFGDLRDVGLAVKDARALHQYQSPGILIFLSVCRAHGHTQPRSRLARWCTGISLRF